MRRLTQEEKDEIARLWPVLGNARKVAEAAGVTQMTAVRYKPGNNKWQQRRPSIRKARAEAVRKAWEVCKNAEQVARMTGLSIHTARLYCPPEKRRLTGSGARIEGYSTWSDAVRKRWDDYWGDPSERRKTILGWNE